MHLKRFQMSKKLFFHKVTYTLFFHRSDWYIKLLAELDLLKDVTRSDEDDSQSLEELSAGGSDQVGFSPSME